MANLRCREYGFGCNYVSKGNAEKIVFDFWEHMNNEHGIDYSKETIMESVKRKNSETPRNP
ncbi:DUF1059 domain-containing protein [Nitrosopumilus ureiphilus]|uniref:DUF1059 domain-containing protein n=1 Tax=Nitrosopumilus ureiphilus TaxID=1470067 RepID=A0A7D5M6R5_9ARCH|nr:DUF1059 domain-containing protein [Nitrosopumilus ureiphilus]QLH06327.1 hypothetical protein C5F50_03980 [Nitrosopumilus ureiphilus]